MKVHYQHLLAMGFSTEIYEEKDAIYWYFERSEKSALLSPPKPCHPDVGGTFITSVN